MGVRRPLAHELPPPADANRVVKSNGYVELTWKGPDGDLIGAYEHRIVAGVAHLPWTEVQVHHINHRPDDNRPENLEVLSPAEHARQHVTFDRDVARDLYESGLSLEQVAARVGATSGSVYRALFKIGVQFRSPVTTKYGQEVKDDVRLLHEAGVTSYRIGEVVGLSASRVRDFIREMGLPPRRCGWVPQAEREAAEAAVADYLERSQREAASEQVATQREASDAVMYARLQRETWGAVG